MNLQRFESKRTPLHRNAYMIALVCALLIRFVWSAMIPVAPVSDSVIYDLMAKHIALGHGATFQSLETPVDQIEHTAYWPVGTSAIYGALYRVFGFYYWPIVTINILANVATIYLAMWLTEQWFSRNHAILTGLILAFWPSQIMFSTVLASELLFTFFLLAALVVWEMASPKKVLAPATAGLLLAAACLIRPTALVIPAILGICSLLKDRDIGNIKNIASKIIVCGLTMILVILPWSFYNQEQFGKFVLISSNGGANFWVHPGLPWVKI